MSWHENIFYITGPWWPVDSPNKDPLMQSFDVFLCVLCNHGSCNTLAFHKDTYIITVISGSCEIGVNNYGPQDIAQHLPSHQDKIS